jgi:pimeloyl-ACP methyl ester carboxylesterase
VRGWLVVALLLTVLGTACRGDPVGADVTPGPLADATTETITTEDGLHLDARLFAADPSHLVILLHMYPANQESWFDTARMLRDRGISALTLDFRGYGASEGEIEPGHIDRDVRGALAFAHDRGYEHVVLVGASMGGTAAIVTAAADPVDGVMTLSAPEQFRGLDAEQAVKSVRVPLALVASEGDTSAAQSLETFEDETHIDPQWVLLADGHAHGTDLLTSPAAPAVDRLLTDFLGHVWGPDVGSMSN